jgi:hypothetical protein
MAEIKALPARALRDISLNEDAYTPDFQIADKYQSYGTELVRLSLLGIAAYGFLMTDLAPAESGKDVVQAVRHSMPLLVIGLLCLALSTATALAHRFFSTDCLTHQVTILRLLKRLEDLRWSNEADVLAKRLQVERSRQARDLRRCTWLLAASASHLSVGTLMLALTLVEVVRAL